MNTIATSIAISVIAYLVLVCHSRLTGISLGLPIAYLFSLLLQHLPGGLAHLTGGYFFDDSRSTEIGLRFTAIGTVAFVVGVILAQRIMTLRLRANAPATVHHNHWLKRRITLKFGLFCLLAGWAVASVASVLGQIPSLGAAIDQASAVWILGVLVGLLVSVRRRNWLHCAGWVAALSVYPLIVLVNGGFLSFGSTSVFVVLAALLMTVRSHVRAYAGVLIFSLFCFLAFLSYFQNRNDIRDAVWGGSPLKERVSRSTTIITGIRMFDPGNPKHLDALDQRLNQNYFAGAAAQRIESGEVALMSGRSVVEGFQALIPRIVWQGKPVFAGSSSMIREMSGFMVNDDTSFGVGQVMEFYINFGIPSVIGGFLLFGFCYGWIDGKLAMALSAQDYASSFIWFLPGIGMLAPLASISEIMGNVAAAVVAAYGWRWAWRWWLEQQPALKMAAPATPRRRRVRSHARPARVE